MTVDDPYLWLEDLDAADAAAWVADRNADTIGELTGGSRFAELQAEIRQVLDSDARIPLVSWHGEHVYNLWKDEAHPRGLWRRATLAQYREPTPDWQVLLDLDALAASEGEPWVWQEVAILRPGEERGLVSLSRGGSDASVIREFDLDRRAFVDGGFALPEAKSDVSWIDRDRIYVGTDFGPGSLTSSGYPRVVKEWRRGTPLSEAATVFEGEPGDVAVTARHDPTPGFARALIRRHLDFFRSEQYLRTDRLTRIDVPEDADVDLHREWLTIRLRSAWGAYPAGALLGARLDAFLAGERDLTVLFQPDPHTSLSYQNWTRDSLILMLLDDVKSRVEILTPGPTGWSRTRLPDDFGHTDIVDTNRDHSDEFLLLSNGFLQPPTLRYGTVGAEPQTLKQTPAFFDTDGLSVRQFFATSADGTRVPYFVVGGLGAGPTLLTGYGGFEVSRTPFYSGTIGRGWLARGGTYVVANIRGGGEYGPDWHQAALREKRPRAYEDFAAVAADLVERGITTKARLGIEGGSNGGLLMGVMLTRYPELFSAIVCNVPLLDMRRYHLLLAGASWMAEYGDPDDPADWAFLREYSPYHNVHSGRKYPPVLFVTSTRDDRVHPGHARKMVAKLRDLGCDVRYYENVEGGHGAAADNAQLAFKSALTLEFLWRTLSDPPTPPR
jgi:prolyl oligopeptidase